MAIPRLLAMALVLSIVPATAFAAVTTHSTHQSSASSMTLSSLSISVSGNGSSQTTTAASNTAGGLGELAGLVISVTYFIYFWGRGSTLGMRLFHLRVADATTGAPIGYGRAALRYVGYILSVIVCYIGLIWAAFDSRKQGWHDKIAGTVVLQD